MVGEQVRRRPPSFIMLCQQMRKYVLAGTRIRILTSFVAACGSYTYS